MPEKEMECPKDKLNTCFAWFMAMQETLTLCAVTKVAIDICADCGDVKGIQIRSANLMHLVDDLKTGCDELERMAADPDLKRWLDSVPVNITDMRSAVFEAESILKKANNNLDAALAQYGESERQKNARFAFSDSEK